jgi:hypothetical protein
MEKFSCNITSVLWLMQRGLNRHRSGRQRGAAILLVVLLLGFTAGAVFFSFFSPNKLAQASARTTSDALAQAKTALINYAITAPHTILPADGSTRPGELPCPDRNNDGWDNDGTCVAGELGRLPWKTLGIADPSDAGGESLWYAVSGAFRTTPSNPAVINSDTRGTLTVFTSDGVTALTSEAAAVIFAPGPAHDPQTRDAPNRNVVANYLDASAGISNTTTNGPFVRGARSNTYNDQLAYITSAEFIPAVEMRVMQALKSTLTSFRSLSACQCYPWANTFAGGGNTSIVGVNRGRLPATALPEAWGANASVALPGWFVPNNWHNAIYYSVAKQNTDGGGATCTTCLDATLTVDGAAGVSALFFTPGTPPAGINRPTNILAAYLRDAQNNDGANDLYGVPSSVATDRNRIMTLASAATANQCTQNAAQLLALAACGQPPRLNPACVALATSLQACTCSAAANQLISPPCENVLNPPQCQAAVATLQACNT